MLKELQILNGTLELEFNEYTNEYTITVDESVDNLDILYKLEENAKIEIKNNNILEGENIVYLRVYNDSIEEIYTLYVYKENTNAVSGIDTYKKSLEVNTSEEVALYKVQLLTGGIFLIIIILFSIMFKRRKNT